MSDVMRLEAMLRSAPVPVVRHDTKKSLAGRLVALMVIPVLIGCLAASSAVGPTIVASRSITAATGIWESIPIDTGVFDQRLAGHTTLLDSDGNVFATFYTEDRVSVDKLSDISTNVIDAVLSTEDRTFYTHGALNEKGLIRAAVFGTGGGSGITQQYAKLLRLNYATDEASENAATEATLSRKLTELKYAVELEKRLSKDDILLGYLNTAYFGDGAYGIGAAARRYFGTTVDKLSVPQAAMLAGLLKSPDQYNPNEHPEAAKDRRDTVLSVMADNGKITEAQAEQYQSEPIDSQSNDLPSGCSVSDYPYFCQYVKETMLSDTAFGSTEAERLANFQKGNLVVHTTLDRTVQDQVQSVLDKNFSSQNVRVAEAVVQPGTGKVLAIAQTTKFSELQINLATDSQVQVGSTFKPITLAAALSQGFNISTKLSGSSPWTASSGFSSPSGGFRNNEGEQFGNIDASEALKYSVNTWFTRLAEQTGVSSIADTAYSMGMESMSPSSRRVGAADLSITLGSFESTPLDLANVYATLAASGVACRALPIASVSDDEGNEQASPDAKCHQAISAAVADTVTQAMSSTQTSGGTASNVSVPGQTWVGKTGTTTDFGATWFAGYTKDFAASVWLGDPRGQSYPVAGVSAFGTFYSQVYGSDVSAPLWAATMRQITQGHANKAFPTPGPITTDTSSVPDVVGMSESAARMALKLAGVETVKSTTVSSDMASGTVVSQKPKAGSTTVDEVDIEVAR